MPKLRFDIDDDGDEVVLDLDRVLLVSEGEDCETRTGWTVDEWVDELIPRFRARAVKFAYWLALKRDGRSPDWNDLDIGYDRIHWDDDSDDDDAAAPADAGVTDGEGPTGLAVEPPPTPDGPA